MSVGCKTYTKLNYYGFQYNNSFNLYFTTLAIYKYILFIKYRIMKIIIVTTIILLLPFLQYAAITDTLNNYSKKNSVYFEFLGNGLTTSLNYERVLKEKRNKLALRSGIGFFPEENFNNIKISIPLELILVFSPKKHHFEIGFGATYYENIIYISDQYAVKNKSYDSSVFLFPRIGYRYTGNNGLLIRIGYTPTIEFPRQKLFDKPFQPFGGISIGYTF